MGCSNGALACQELHITEIVFKTFTRDMIQIRVWSYVWSKVPELSH